MRIRSRLVVVSLLAAIGLVTYYFYPGEIQRPAVDHSYWRHLMSNGWTPQRKARQAQLIKTWRPWERSTGPKTKAGKAIVGRNAWKGAERNTLRELARLLKNQRGG